MIVTDTNVVAYLLLGGVHFEAARAIYRRDHEWSAPVLWRSEFANVLAGSMRRGELSVTAAESTYGLAEELVRNREYFVPPSRVLQMVAASPCSAYDCEFVALAQILGVRLVTADRAILQAFPQVAIAPNRFVELS